MSSKPHKRQIYKIKKHLRKLDREELSTVIKTGVLGRCGMFALETLSEKNR